MPSAGEKEVTPGEAYAAFLARMERYEQLEVFDQNWEEERNVFVQHSMRTIIWNVSGTFTQRSRGREYEYEHLLVYFYIPVFYEIVL